MANHVGNRFLGAGQAYAGPSVVGYPIGNGFAKDFKKYTWKIKTGNPEVS